MQGFSTDGDALITEEPQNKIVGSEAQQKQGNFRLKSTAQKNSSSKKLERHTISLWLASVFAIASIFMWGITCTLSYKPVQFQTYFETTGRFSRDQYEHNDRWRRVSRVGLQVLGTLSIPITSVVCARAAVVYCQRSSNKRQPAISMRQMLVLADKGWLDLKTWMNLFSPMGGRIYSPLLILSMFLCGLGENKLPSSKPIMILIFLEAFSISILQGASIDTISITVMTKADTDGEPYMHRSGKDHVLYSTVGRTLSMLNSFGYLDEDVDQDLEKDMQLSSVIEATIAGKAGDLQPNLWVIGRNSSNLTSIDSFYSSTEFGAQTAFRAKPFFTSSLTVGTDTGILKALALRMSTSLQCEGITHAEFPFDCNETASLAMNFTNTQFQRAANQSDAPYVAPIFSFHIWSSGAKNWTRNNDSSNSIQEELYMDLQTWQSTEEQEEWNVLTGYTIPGVQDNFTFHCIADSHLAYFEPMNEWNGHQVQDMVDIRAKVVPHFTGPNTRSNTHGLIYSPAAAGPLATSVRALFGNNTFFNSIINAHDTRGANLDVCRALRMPLTGLCTMRDGESLMCNPYQSQSESTLPCIRPAHSHLPEIFEENTFLEYGLSNSTSDSGTLAYFLYVWLQRFNNWNSTMAALTFTNFYSAKAILDPSRAMELDPYTAFETIRSIATNKPLALTIYSSPGLRIQKLHISSSAIVIISLLILLHIAGLLALGVYTSMQPIWTASLDGFALLRMGKGMKDALPLISAADAGDADVLDWTEGWIGDEREDEDEDEGEDEDEDEEKGVGSSRVLQLGGRGDVKSQARYRTIWDPET